MQMDSDDFFLALCGTASRRARLLEESYFHFYSSQSPIVQYSFGVGIPPTRHNRQE